MTELLPCPFCGGDAQVVPAYGTFYVECITCYASAGLPEEDEENAIEQWNGRTPPSG